MIRFDMFSETGPGSVGMQPSRYNTKFLSFGNWCDFLEVCGYISTFCSEFLFRVSWIVLHVGVESWDHEPTKALVTTCDCFSIAKLNIVTYLHFCLGRLWICLFLLILNLHRTCQDTIIFCHHSKVARIQSKRSLLSMVRWV